MKPLARWTKCAGVKWQPLLAGGLLLILLSACALRRGVPYVEAGITPQPIPVPAGYYADVVWLRPNLLVLHYFERPDFGGVLEDGRPESGWWVGRLMVYALDTGAYWFLPDEIPADCYETWYGNARRLPDGNLAYLRECLPNDAMRGRDSRLHRWEVETGVDREIYAYPPPFWATDFVFAPDMTRWFQEQAGDGLNNELYFVEPGQAPVQVLAEDFVRVGAPAWLPGDRLLLPATRRLPESKFNPFTGALSLGAQFYTPWEMYLTDVASVLKGEVGEEAMILRDLWFLSGFRASPDGSKVAFWARIGGWEDEKRGLWVLRLSDRKLVRIVSYGSPYDWSPDGTELVILGPRTDSELHYSAPARFRLPAYLLE